jgi:hypothetical protein
MLRGRWSEEEERKEEGRAPTGGVGVSEEERGESAAVGEAGEGAGLSAGGGGGGLSGAGRGERRAGRCQLGRVWEKEGRMGRRERSWPKREGRSRPGWAGI